MTSKRISTGSAARAVLAVLLLSGLAVSCRSLPPATDPAYQRAERDAREALPFDAALFLAVSPSELPAFQREILASMPAKQASSMKTVLSATRMAYVAYTPPGGQGAEGMPAWYALLSGRYPPLAINAGLSTAKDVHKKGEWYELNGGIKLALDGDRRILITNADMPSFLERLKAPSKRLERQEGAVHPISLAAESRTGAARAYAPGAGSNLLGALGQSAGSLPIDSMALDVEESGGKEIVDAEFSFQSETSAKVFAPAMRAVLNAAIRLLGLDGPAPELKREGSKLRAAGITVDPKRLGSLFASMAVKAK